MAQSAHACIFAKSDSTELFARSEQDVREVSQDCLPLNCVPKQDLGYDLDKSFHWSQGSIRTENKHYPRPNSILTHSSSMNSSSDSSAMTNSFPTRNLDPGKGYGEVLSHKDLVSDVNQSTEDDLCCHSPSPGISRPGSFSISQKAPIDQFCWSVAQASFAVETEQDLSDLATKYDSYSQGKLGSLIQPLALRRDAHNSTHTGPPSNSD